MSKIYAQIQPDRARLETRRNFTSAQSVLH